MIKNIKQLTNKIVSYEIIRYWIWWGIALLIDLIILYILTDILWIWYILSAIIAFLISFLFSYFFQKYITFRDKSKKHLLQWWLFLAFQTIWQWIYLLILRLWVDILWFYYMFVAIVWKWIAFIRNYLSNHYFNFKNK